MGTKRRTLKSISRIELTTNFWSSFSFNSITKVIASFANRKNDFANHIKLGKKLVQWQELVLSSLRLLL